MDLLEFSPYKVKKINEIFHIFFNNSLFYVQRYYYSMQEYVKHNITFTWRRLLLPTWLAVNAWSMIIFFILVVFRKLPDYTFLVEIPLTVMKINNFDLLIYYVLLTYSLWEIKWMSTFSLIINYKLPFNSICLSYWRIRDCRLNRKNDEKYLINFFIKSSYTCGTIFRLSVFGLIPLWIMFLKYLSSLYMKQVISLRQFLVCSTMLIACYIKAVHIIGELIIEMLFLLFTAEYLKIHIQRTIKLLSLWIIFASRYRMLPQYYCRQYVIAFSRIGRFRVASKPFLMQIEMVTKISFTMAILFYWQQSQINIFNGFITLVFVSMFCFPQFLYLRLTMFPYYNECFYKLMFSLNARKQLRMQQLQTNRNISKRSQRVYKIMDRLNLREMIMRNLQTQIACKNEFGFYCGPFFFITRAKFAEMFIANFVFAIMVYKKICLYNVNLDILNN